MTIQYDSDVKDTRQSFFKRKGVGGVELVSFFTNIISSYMPTLITSYTNNIFTLYGECFLVIFLTFARYQLQRNWNTEYHIEIFLERGFVGI